MTDSPDDITEADCAESDNMTELGIDVDADVGVDVDVDLDVGDAPQLEPYTYNHVRPRRKQRWTVLHAKIANVHTMKVDTRRG